MSIRMAVSQMRRSGEWGGEGGLSNTGKWGEVIGPAGVLEGIQV